MIEISFDPNATLLRFECKIEFQTTAGAILALDTGASSVTLSRPILERIGYNLDAVMEHESFGNASQSHTVPKITLKALSIETARLENVDVLCYTLPAEYGIDGVIGLNYLRRFRKVTIDFERGILTLAERTK